MKLVTTALIGKEARMPWLISNSMKMGPNLLRCAGGMNRQASLILKQQGNAEFHLTETIVSVSISGPSAALRFIKKLPLLLLQKMHPTEQKARDICKAGIQQFSKVEKWYKTIGKYRKRITISTNFQEGNNGVNSFLESKIAALNFRKLFGFRKGLGNYHAKPDLWHRNKPRYINNSKGIARQ